MAVKCLGTLQNGSDAGVVTPESNSHLSLVKPILHVRHLSPQLRFRYENFSHVLFNTASTEHVMKCD